MAGMVWIVTTTVGTGDEATGLARMAVETGLAACAQVDAEMVSHYRWEGALQQSRETRIVFKVSSTQRDKLMDWLRKTHPYEVPQILAWEAVSGVSAYTDWVKGT